MKTGEIRLNDSQIQLISISHFIIDFIVYLRYETWPIPREKYASAIN